MKFNKSLIHTGGIIGGGPFGLGGPVIPGGGPNGPGGGIPIGGPPGPIMCGGGG